jgi:hypothetical protein
MRARVAGKLATTISIGVAANNASESATSLISRADAAMYTAKNQGRNCVCVHEGTADRIATVPATSASPGEKPSAYDHSTPEAESNDLLDADPAEVHVLYGDAI